MEGRCTECGTNTIMHHYIDTLCYNCYENLFKDAPKKVEPVDEEPDFELKNDVAQITTHASNIPVDQLVYTDDRWYKIENPKQMVFDHDCRVKDYDKLVVFILENLIVLDNAKGFDKVRYMFKEVDK